MLTDKTSSNFLGDTFLRQNLYFDRSIPEACDLNDPSDKLVVSPSVELLASNGAGEGIKDRLPSCKLSGLWYFA